VTEISDRPADDEQHRLNQQEAEQVEPTRPPDVNQESNRSATRLELFFDLAFVLFVARCADVLAKDETWHGALVFTAVLAIGWWAWASTTLYANRFDTDDVVFRLLTLVAMSGVVAMAAAVGKLDGATAHWFVVGYVTVRFALVAGYLRAWRHVRDARTVVGLYLLGHGFGAVIWLVSLAVPVPGRYWLWGAGVLLDMVGPAAAARVEQTVPLHIEHLPERFGLFIILVLGESVAGIVAGLHDGEWKGSVVVGAALAFVVAAALWWSYFDLSGGAAKRRLVEEGADRTQQGVHDFYLYSHLPLVLFLATTGIGLEHAVTQAGDDHLSAGTRWALSIGVAGYLLSAALMQAVLGRRIRGSLLWPGGGVPLVLLVAALDLLPVLTMVLLAAVTFTGVLAGYFLHRAGEVRTAKV